ncbi:MAG: hypothetical protein LBQ47_07595 [Endomicrobium sp.]|jgi:hypothetical protein|nr:hypothetical protein [Endomicrobium sp.]
MKFLKIFFSISLLFIYAFSLAAYNPKSNKKKHSVLGNSKSEIYGQFDEYDKFKNITAVEPSGAVISTYTVSAFDFEEPLPETVQEKAGNELLNYLNEGLFSNLGYSPGKWKKRASGEDAVRQSSSAVSAGHELPPGIMAKLPFESQLSLSGRKLIGFNYNARNYDKEEDGKRKNSSSFKMEQELQMRVVGKVGERLNINVDYDDTADKKDISLAYKGLPGEFIQEAAFGDISVSIPQSEFVSYSKELFGLKLDTRYKTFNANAFFSQTKGASEIKRFTGNTQLERRTIADTSYIKLKYYSVLAAGETRQIKSGSAQVFIDYQRIDPKLNISITTATPLNYLVNPVSPADEYRGNFVLLTPGQDYTIDYNTGIIIFKNPLLSNYVAAVNYQFTDNSQLSSLPLIFKDLNNTSNPSTGHTTELKTFYNLGNLKIIRDNGRGNFLLQLQDLNGTVLSSTDTIEGGKPVPKYPSTINVDFENGVFNLVPAGGKPLADDLYDFNTHRYNFVTEYQYTVKILTLRPAIVPQSEKVTVDGLQLTANSDYIIDYDLGILTIIKENVIKETSVIDVTYDYSMFGAESESTLIGGRAQLNLTNDITLGGSLLYNFTAKGGALPDIRSTPTSLMVAEGDAKINDLSIDALNVKINAAAEYAFSSQDDNTSGKALIDSMDSAVYEDFASMIDENWFHSSFKSNGSIADRRNLSDLSWQTKEIYLRDIDPSLELIDGQKQLTLEISYNVTTRSEIAFAQKLSASGYDFSKKLYVDVWIKQDFPLDADLYIDYASAINEDANYKNADPASSYYGKLFTEDADNNGVLSPWEDTGQQYLNADGSISLIGAHNGRLDTEDLNGNGILDVVEEVAESVNVKTGAVIKNHNGWIQYRVQINALSSPENWKNIRILRLRIKKNSSESGKMIIGKIAITGNKWEESGTHVSSFTISAIGNSDQEYKDKSLLLNSYYRELYDIDESVRKDEQALKIAYGPAFSNEEFFAKSVYSGDALDISKYDSLRFFVYAKEAAVGDVLVFRAGGNDNNYFEFKITRDSDPSWNDWKLITIDQPGSGRARSWTCQDPSAVISAYGLPSLEKISQITLGVISTAGSSTDKYVWFNEIHVKGSKTLDGAAWKAGGNIRWNGNKALGAITAGAFRKTSDRDFQTVTAGVHNRDYTEDNAYLNFDGVKTETLNILPFKAGISKIRTYTPKIDDKESNLVSINEQGNVVNYTGFAETNLNFGVDFPQISAQYSRSLTDTEMLARLEDKEILSGNLVYNNPLSIPVLPINVTANASMSNSYYKVYPDTPIANSDSFLGLDALRRYMDISDYHTLEKSNSFSVKLPFKFSKGVSFTPSYLIDTVKEKNRDFAQEIEYDKTLNQTVGASMVMGLASWFAPTFTYSINTKENYNVNASTDSSAPVFPGEKKYVERIGIGEISWNLNAYDIAASRFLKSMSFSAYYRLQDSDSYDNVDKNFKSTGFTSDKLWIRNNLLMEILPSYSSGSYMVKTVLNRNDIRINGRYMPFEAFGFKGILSPLTSLTANFTYTEGSENSYVTGTLNDVYTQIWPDLLIGMSGIERFFGSLSWMSDSQLNLKYNDKDITTYGVSYAKSVMYGADYRCKILKMLDLYFSFENVEAASDDYATLHPLSDSLERRISGQGAVNVGKWRISLRYVNEDLWQRNALGKYSSQVLRNSYLGQINSDLTFPAGIKIPIINKVLPLKNRIIFESQLKYISQSSGVNIETDNNLNYGLSLNADYEISKYFRFLLGGSWERMEYSYNGDLNYADITLITKLTIQF